MRWIKEWFARQKEKSRELKRQEIAGCFQVKEKSETFCIVHNGDVIHDFSPTAKISEVISELNKKRETALKYSGI